MNNLKPGFLFFMLILLLRIAPAQLNWMISTESGMFISDLGSEDLFTRLEAQGEYKYSSGRQQASAKIKIHRGFFHLNPQFKSFKFLWSGNYLFEKNGQAFLFDITRKGFLYSGSDQEYDQYITRFQAGYIYTLAKKMSLVLQPGYLFQKVKFRIFQNVDIIYSNILLKYKPNRETHYSSGIYTERFNHSVDGAYYYQFDKIKLDGWRVGPFTGYAYLKNFLINADYRFLVHHSNLTEKFSAEHWFRVLFAKSLNSKISFLAYLDYTLRNIDYRQEQTEIPDFRYIPSQFENQFYLKLLYKFSAQWESYLKTGYFSEQPAKNIQNFSGWNAMIGISVRNLKTIL